MRPFAWVVRSCYLGMFVQAMVINLTPLLFIPLRDQFSLTFEQVGRLVLVNFLTQMAVDLACTALADRVNPKPLIIGANFLAAAGLWVFSIAPFFFANPYDGLLLGTVIFSIGCGLLEVLLSPIINAVPSERKSGDMALLHAFYPIGKVLVVVVTGLVLYFLGARAWPWILLAWSVVPLANTLAFALVRLPPLAHPETRQTLRSMFQKSEIFLLLGAMALAGATEVTVAQWASAYVEKGLGFPKIAADLAGFGLFAIGMVIGRLWFGFRGEHTSLRPVMLASAAWSAGMCVLMVIPFSPWIALIACAASGLFITMLWPGTISLAAARYPLAGASLFALLAAAGDSGAAFMPWLVGVIADQAAGWNASWLPSIFGPHSDAQSLGLRVGLLVTALCPLLMIPLVRRLTRPS